MKKLINTEQIINMNNLSPQNINKKQFINTELNINKKQFINTEPNINKEQFIST